ncbi:MAG: hypothetical protein WDN26_02490 [Chitinophagaceae bacterium]
MAYGPGDGNKGLQSCIGLVEELRGALGDEGQIMFDAFMAGTYHLRCNGAAR